MSEAPSQQLFDWEEVARALFHERRITEGLWHVGVGLRFAGVTSPWQEEGAPAVTAIPTGVIGMFGIALTPTSSPGMMVFDAKTGRASILGVQVVPPSSLPKALAAKRAAASRGKR